MKLLIPILVVLFSVGIISSVHGQEDSQLPDWVKNIFVWYAGDEISEAELLQAIQYLADEKIIVVNSGYACGPGTEAVDGVCQITEIIRECTLIENRTFGPSGYKSFEDSPFETFKECTYFYLEDFENNGLLTPGVSSDGASMIPGEKTDSVDYDDKLLDGSGNDGHSFYTGTSQPWEMQFTFNKQILNELPVYIGLVATDMDRSGGGEITFEAFDESGLPIDKIDLNFGGGFHHGKTEGDRFIGISYSEGISIIQLKGNGSFEIDHLQYGR